MKLGQFRPDLGHEAFDVLRQRGFTFALIEFLKTALLTFGDMAVDAIHGSLRVPLLDRAHQVLMITADLLQGRQRMAATPCREDSNQKPKSSERLQAPLVAGELHDVSVKGQVGNLEPFHLILVQERFAAGFEFFDQRRQRGGG